MLLSIKVLVCYHKPARLLKDGIFVPIYVGKACAGDLSPEDRQWLCRNMIGDDTGDNISHLNQHFCELTAIYWAWKNYDKLGNPDYIGLCHYRRIFDAQDIRDALNYDITASVDKVHDGKNISEQFSNVHRTNDLNEAINLLSAKYVKTAQTYLQQKNGYFYNMFIMKKELFFEYCDYLFGILMKIHKKTNYDKYSFYNQRMPGFVAERLTGIFIAQKEAEKFKLKKSKVLFDDVGCNTPISPVFSGESVNICLSADDNYAEYLGVTIQSIKMNKSSADKYDICILDSGISFKNKNKIIKMVAEDFSVRFIDISGYLASVDKSIFSLNQHFTIAAYYRLFIPQVFANYKKVLYLDCDLIVNTDIAELFHTDLGNFAIGAAKDIEITRRLATDKFYGGNIYKYLADVLKMKHPKTYFQSGVLLLDIAKLVKTDFTNGCLNRLKEIGEPLYVDQCVLNSLFDGNYKKLDMKWNVMWQLPYYVKDLDRQLDRETYSAYMASRAKPYVVHYASATKPWRFPKIEMADIWWKYARLTPFYEEILSELNYDTEMLRAIFNYRKDKLCYLKYKIFSKITFGKMRKHCKQKKKELKSRLKEVRKFLKGK